MSAMPRPAARVATHPLAMLLRSSAAFAMLGCRPDAPVTTSPTNTPTTTPVADDPAFLRVDVDLATAYPWHAKIVRAASVRLEHDATPVGDASNRNIDLPVVVIDEDTRAEVQRPRVLCVHAAHRIAVHYEADDLGLVAREGAVLSATPVARAQWADDAPGVRLAAGTPLRTEGDRGGSFVRAALELPAMRMSGFIDSPHVGRTYRPTPFATPDAILDAKLREAASVLASPGGPEMARLRPEMSAGGLGLRRLGRTQAGHVLVAVPGEHTRIVGWVDAKAVESATLPARGRRVVAPGFGEVEGEPSVELPAGTMLHGGALRNRVGVVTTGGRFYCVDACDGDAPVVEVAACTVAVSVVARRPR